MTMTRIAYLASTMALATAAVPASATVITFNNFDTSGPFGGNGQPFTTYTESGFTLSAPAGQYVQSTSAGAVSNNALVTGANNGTAAALLTLTGVGLFTFGSFDAFAVNTAAIYTVTGYLGTTQVYAASGSIGVPPIYGTYSTYGGFSGAAVDRITIATTAGYQLFLDNVTTGTAPAAGAVPEPATWAMMIAGFGLVGGTMRRRSTRIACAA